jgi:hypothetical protein
MISGGVGVFERSEVTIAMGDCDLDGLEAVSLSTASNCKAV